MLDELKLIVPMMDREFLRGSFNGTALMQTLDGLSFGDVLSKDNPSGMSAWEVFCHDIFCKYMVLTNLSPDDEFPSVPFVMIDMPPLPSRPSEEEWEGIKTFGREVHGRLVRALSDASSSDLDRVIPVWKCTVRNTLAWLPGHDAYHNAQVRNSGLSVAEPIWEYGLTE